LKGFVTFNFFPGNIRIVDDQGIKEMNVADEIEVTKIWDHYSKLEYGSMMEINLDFTDNITPQTTLSTKENKSEVCAKELIYYE